MPYMHPLYRKLYVMFGIYYKCSFTPRGFNSPLSAFIYPQWLSLSFIFLHLLPFAFILFYLPSFTPITFHSPSSAFIYPHYLHSPNHLPSGTLISFHSPPYAFIYPYYVSFSFIWIHLSPLAFTLLHLLSYMLITFHSPSSTFIYPH